MDGLTDRMNESRLLDYKQQHLKDIVNAEYAILRKPITLSRGSSDHLISMLEILTTPPRVSLLPRRTPKSESVNLSRNDENADPLQSIWFSIMIKELPQCLPSMFSNSEIIQYQNILSQLLISL